jgi:repressor LexA
MGNNQFEKVLSFYRRHRRMPSYTEIMKLLGYRSKNAAYKFVNRLIEYGFIERDRTNRIIPGRLFTEVRVLGTVKAGFPSPAEEELSDTMSLDEYLIHNKDATYLFKVSGDSMIDAGIMDGDMALVERGRTPKDGDIVLAEIDREWTLKYFRKRTGKVWLEPANKKYKSIYPNEELKIPAVLVSVVRKYKL